MTVLRANIDFAKRIFADRLGNDYVYGGVWNPFNIDQGCDCSALVSHILNAAVFGPNMTWQRVDPTRGNAWVTTESWRPIEPGQVGPFGTIDCNSPAEFPPDAAVRIAIHHGPGGGANSHMNCQVEGIYMESSGSHGCCSNDSGAIPHSSPYWNDFAYLPGPIEGALTPPPPPSPLLWGVDISNHQGDIDIAAIKQEGYSFLWAKIGEANNYRDPFWPRNRDLARANGLLLAGYHYVREWADPESQAALIESHIGDKSIPVMIDFENGSGDMAMFWAVKNAIERRGMAVRLSYIPDWYWERIGSPDLSAVPGLITSNFVNGSDYASRLYPGDNWEGWHPYGNRTPDILQFTSQAQVAGHQIDAMAFKGTREQLQALLTGGPVPEGEPMADYAKLAYEQLMGLTQADGLSHGWEQLGGRSIVDYLAAVVGPALERLEARTTAPVIDPVKATALLLIEASALDVPDLYPERQAEARHAADQLATLPPADIAAARTWLGLDQQGKPPLVHL